MAHELATTNGQAAMCYYGETPWHGLGTELKNPATAQEAIVAAGLDYQVELAPLQTTDGIPVRQRKAVIRTDTQEPLGVVGNGYVPIQNREAFSFLDAVVADNQLRYHTAGALRRGERIWLLAKLPGTIQVKTSDDVSDKYLLLSNSHDGSSSLRVHFTAVRVVCANTMAVALREGRGQGLSIVHKGDLAAKVAEARKVLGLANRFFDDLGGQFNRLAYHYPTPQQVANYFKALYPDLPDGRESTRANNVRDELHRLFEEGIGQDMPGTAGTTWAAFNAVTEFVDHMRGTRGRNPAHRATSRLESVLFGSGARLKAKAFDLALTMTQT